MTTANPSNYWISGNALRITLNANGDADYIQGNTASGAMILCFIKDVSGLGYDAGHNYQRWKLLLSPTYFATKSVKYVYVAIPRAGKKVPQDFAQVVFPSEKLDIYGKNASEQQIGSTDYYYIWLQGIISASEVGGVLQDRVWTAQIQTGTLASDEAFESGGDSTWWRYSSVSDTVTFLKTIAHAVFERMRVTTRLIFGNSDDSENYVSGVANNNTSDTSEHDIVTPAYGKEKFLSRKNNDTASGWITFIKGLRTVIDFVSGATGSGGAFYQEQSGTYSRAHLETDVARIREMLLGSLDVEENLHVGGSETIGTSAAGQNTMADGTTVNNYRQKVGGNARIDGVLVALSKIYSNLLRSQNFNGDGLFDSGFELTKDDGTGHSYLVVDKLYVRLKAIFEALEIRKMIYSGGNFIFSHAGGKVVKVREIREELTASVDGNTLMLTGPVNITGSTLYIDGGARVENGTLVITGESTLYAYRCYFLTDDGTTRTENWWQVDDQARCQTYNIKEGVYEHVSNQSYWRRVLAVGRETLDDGKEYDYIDLSVVDCMSGSTVPKEGDDLVQCGNRTDPERQGFITLEIAGEYAPALKIYKNVNGYTTSGKRKICLSPKYTELIVNKFVQETEYDVQQVPMERGEWELIPGNKCYYYNLVQHNGASWLCIYPEEGVNGVLYTVEEPSENAVWWRPYAQRGKDGEDGKSFNIKGTFDTYAEFDAAEKVYEEGVAYVVAGFLYIYDPLVNNFKNAGQFKGDPGRGIKSATISYGVSDSSSVTPNEWKSSPSALALEQGVYLWVRTILVYTDGEQSSPSYNISYFGKDGSFKNTVFCRTNTDISSLQPNGGTWDNPIPNPSSGVVWSDGIPAGESRLWATSAVFSPTGQMSEWTKPKPMTDTTDTDVEFSPSTAKPANPGDVISEREAQGWYDPDRNPSFDFTTTIWRAERHCKNGIWGNWAVERIKGEKGDSITIDAQNSKTEYAASNQGTSAPSSGWSTTIPSVPQGQFLWTRVTTVYSDGSSTVSYGVSYNAADGADGSDGTSVTITSKSVKYAVTNNGTQPADSSFTYNSIPPLELGQYLWTKTEVAYSDGNSTKAYSVSRLGTDGAQGIQGPNGKTTHFAYAKMKAGQSIPSTGKITTAMVDSWSRTNFPGADAIGTYDDTTTEDSDNIADYTWTEWKGDKGEKGDSITVDVQKSKTEYAASSQGTSAPSSGWSTTIPDVPQGQFLWTRVTTAYSDGSSTVSYGVSYNAEDGTPGTSITITSKSVKYAVTNNGTQPADSSFTYNAIPSSLKLGQYLWTKTEVVYSDGNSTKAYSVSRLGTDGPQGIQGPNGKTTHFAYAMMKAGQSIPSTGKITTAMVDSWSRTNFSGADAIGTYDDTTTEDSDNIADYTWTEWKGEKGDSITIDTQNSKTEYVASNQGTSAPSSGWSPTIPDVPQGQFLWTRVTTAYSDGSSTVSYGVSYNAEDGTPGTSITITSKSVKYAVTNNGTQPADSSFTYNAIPSSLELGQYLWTKTEVVYSDGNSTKAYSVSRLGTDGPQGIQGPNGKTTHFAYAKMKAGQSIPSTGKITTAMVDSWSRTNFSGADAIGTYDDTTTEDSDNIADYTWTEWKGDKGDSITIDTQNSKTEYVASNQGTSAPSSGWSPTIPDVPQGQFLWTRVTTAYSDGSSTVSYGVSYNAEDGTPGTSITITSKSVKYAVTNNGTQPADSSFTYNAIPSSLELGQYLWTKTEVVYSDGNSTKAYSVSRLGTDGPQGIQGPNGKTTHFAYAKMKAGQSIPSTGKITTAMVDSWSRTNFPGADAIGTYDDTTTEDSDNIADYTWTEWKGEKGDKGDKGDSGSSAASVVLDTSVISVPVDTDGYVVDNFRAEVGVRLYVAGKDVVATEISIDEQDGSSLVSAPANALAAMPWATEDDYELNDGQINFKRNASINENTLVLTGDAWAVVPDRLIVEVKKGTLLREHAANLTVGGSDEDKNYIEGFASIAIQRQYVPTNGREGADAVSMMLTKYNVILNQQQSGAKTIPLDDAYTDVMAYVGDMNVTGNAVITATPSKVDDQPVCAVSVSGGRVTITSIGTYKETVDGKEKTYYYDKGEVFIQVSYNGKKYPLVFGFSCNLLGTWKEEVENDTQKIVAQRISYVVNNGDPTKTIEQTKNTFTQMSSSVGQVSEWKEEKENVYDGYDQRITNTNTRVSNAESNISTISHTRPQEDIFSKGLSDWVLNDNYYSDADFDNKYPRYYAVGEITDIYSPVVALSAGEYCFSAYVPSDREFDTDGNTIALMQGCTASNPGSGYFIEASNVSTVSDDTITIRVTENGEIVEKIYYRRYATFRITGNVALCSINVWGDGAKFADVVRPKLEVGSSATPYVMSSSVVKQTADALIVQINGKASHSEVTQTAEQISATITNKLGETGININGDTRSIRLQADTTIIDSDVIVGSLKTKPDANGFFTEINGGENRVAKKNGNTIQDVMRWGVFSIDGSFSNVSSQIFYKDGNPSLVINCYGMFSITGEQTTTESAYWSWIKYYHKETTQGVDTTGLMDALRWAETKGHTTGSEIPVKATAEYYIFHCAKRTTDGVTTVIHPELEGLVYSETGTIGIDMDITGGTLANAGYYIEWDSDEFVGRKQVLSYYMQVFRVRASKVGSDNKIAYRGWIYYGYDESTPSVWVLTTSSGAHIALDRQTFGAYLDQYHD